MIISSNHFALNASSPLRQMGNSCVKKTSVPCFRVAPQPIEEDNRDKVIYCLPWEAKKKTPVKVPQPCCFCWCCLCTCTCKYNFKKSGCPTTDDDYMSSILDVDSILMGEKKVSSDRLNQWKSDFDSLIKDEAGKQLFQEFLRKEYSDENLLFWIDVERMKEVQDGATRYITIRKIYKDYIQPRAKKEVNVEAWVRKAIETSLDKPSLSIFDLAQTQVYLLMYRQSWPRFLASKNYLRLYARTKDASVSEG